MITAILSTRDDEIGLALALSALVPAATEGIVREAIVVDGGSRDGTLAVADAAGCTIVPDAGDGLRQAASAARGDWLLFLTPAAVLETGWQSEVIAFVDRATMAGEARRRAAAFRFGRMDGGFAARDRFGIGSAAAIAALLALRLRQQRVDTVGQGHGDISERWRPASHPDRHRAGTDRCRRRRPRGSCLRTGRSASCAGRGWR